MVQKNDMIDYFPINKKVHEGFFGPTDVIIKF